MVFLKKINVANIPLPSSPAEVQLNWEKTRESKEKQVFNGVIFNDEKAKKLIECIFGNSEYLSNIILKYPVFFAELLQSELGAVFEDLLNTTKNYKAQDEEDIKKFLREMKLKTSLLIAIAEITKYWSVEVTTDRLSVFADICISKVTEFLLLFYHTNQTIKLKNPKKPFEGSGLAIISVGKLGSNELNYSSDIDLAVFYEDEKLKYMGRKNLQQFYIEVAQKLTDILSTRTKDGYVFRVDMRLRPDPGANPLAVSLKKAEKYYFTVGQNWERAAMIKARFVCGDKKAGDIFSEFMGRNVWRKTLDFETIEDIHSIKRQIDTKQGVHPKNMYGYNVKLGKGGIREIEFYAQTQQLIWGGKKPALRQKKTSDALFALAKDGEMSEAAAEELKDAYLFYRMVEHRLQMVNDDQTHTLPTKPDELDRIAVFCGFLDRKDFFSTLGEKITTVRNHYSKLFEASPSLASDLPEAQGSLIFTGTENHPDTIATLSKMGFGNPNRVSDIVRGWHHGRYNITVKKRARAELTKLMPNLFVAFAKSPDPDEAFIKFDEFLSKLPENSQIFALLYLNPDVLKLMAEIMGGYPEIAVNLSKNPQLIEYVLEREFHKTLPEKESLISNLEKLIPEKTPLDGAVEIIKAWASEQKFKVGIQLVRNNISTDELFVALSDITETVLRVALKLAEKEAQKNNDKITGQFAAIAFGKFGSKELTFNSDLDVVFIYDAKTLVNSKISAAQYYVKLAGRVVEMLSSVTAEGKLFDVDMRLRPLGESSAIATSLQSFEGYYSKERKEGTAWVFEYMALTRSRAISTNFKFEKKLDKIIKEKLQYKWDNKTLHKEAIYICEKFHKSKTAKNEFDVKNAEGGLFDLEFMVRFLQLKYLHKHPGLYGQSTSYVINALLKNKVISDKEYKIVSGSYEIFKKIQNITRITSKENISKYTLNIIAKLLNVDSGSEVIDKLSVAKKEIKILLKRTLDA